MSVCFCTFPDCTETSCSGNIVQPESSLFPDFNRTFTWDFKVVSTRAFQLDFPEAGMQQIPNEETCPDEHTYSLVTYLRTGLVKIGTFCRGGTVTSVQVRYKGRVSLQVPGDRKLNPVDFKVSSGPETSSKLVFISVRYKTFNIQSRSDLCFLDTFSVLYPSFIILNIQTFWFCPYVISPLWFQVFSHRIQKENKLLEPILPSCLKAENLKILLHFLCILKLIYRNIDDVLCFKHLPVFFSFFLVASIVKVNLPRGVSDTNFLSPNYPREFPDNEQMQWSFTVPGMHNYTMHFHDHTAPECLNNEVVVEYQKEDKKVTKLSLTDPQPAHQQGNFNMILKNCETNRTLQGLSLKYSVSVMRSGHPGRV